METANFGRPANGTRTVDRAVEADIPRARRVTTSRVLQGIVILGAITVALGAATMFPPTPPSLASRYHTETVSRGPVGGVLRVPAVIESKTTVRVGTPAAGRVAAVTVSVGDRVKRGQVLARLEDEDLRAQAAGVNALSVAAHADAREAQIKLGRIMHVLEQADRLEDIPPSAMPVLAELQQEALSAETQFVRALANVRHQESAVRAARVTLRRAVLRAPMDGVIVARSIEPGEIVAPGPAAQQPLFVVASDPTQMRVVATVNERDAARIRGGGARFVVSAYPERTFAAVVEQVEFAPVSSGAHAYRVLLHAPNPTLALRPGMTAMLSLEMESAPTALRVPVTAITFKAQGVSAPEQPKSAIWVMSSEKKPRRIPVELGVTDGSVIEVREAAVVEGTQVLVGVTDQ